MAGGFFFQAFVYLAAAVVAVPIAKRFGLGSVLGYLLAGIVLGPFCLGFLGEQGQDVMHFAEFGVVMMLFVIGLELEPTLLWRMRGPVLGLGGAQVLGTTAACAAIAMAFGLDFKVSLAVGMTLSLSSTAIVLSTLSEKGLLRTDGGQKAFAVLLFQDIAVIPMLALMPLLRAKADEGANLAEGAAAHGAAETLHAGLPTWAQGLVVIVVILAVVTLARFVLTPAFRFVAKARMRETFTATSLLLVIGMALLMTAFGLSPALGTFIAGVTLATNEYRHELEAEIEPFKGLLLGLFFISVGASIDFGLVIGRPGLVALLVSLLVVVKFVLLLATSRAFGTSIDQGLLLSVALAQGGEFAFVLFSFATDNHIVPKEVANPLVAAVAISMALTPLMLLGVERLVLPRFGTKESTSREADEIHEDNPVIICGYGRFGQIVGRLLRGAGYECTLLDIDSDQVDVMRKFGARVYYGDATRPDLLRSAGAEKAKLIVLAIDNREKTLELVHTIKKHFPHLVIMARAGSRTDAFDLLDAGVEHIYRELLDSSLRLGRDALRLLGMRAYPADRVTRAFRRRDEHIFQRSARHRHDQAALIDFVKREANNLEEVLRAEYEQRRPEEQSWSTETLARELSSEEVPAAGEGENR